MKIIVREYPNELDKHFSKIENIDNFLLDKETYEYFLFKIYDKGLKKFVKEKDTELGNIVELTMEEYLNLGNNKEKAAFEYSRAMFKVEREYTSIYNNQRKKFYEYKNHIYSFTYMGMTNSPNEINLIRHDIKDVSILLNRLLATVDKEQNKNIWQFILEKFRS